MSCLYGGLKWRGEGRHYSTLALHSINTLCFKQHRRSLCVRKILLGIITQEDFRCINVVWSPIVCNLIIRITKTTTLIIYALIFAQRLISQECKKNDEKCGRKLWQPSVRRRWALHYERQRRRQNAPRHAMPQSHKNSKKNFRPCRRQPQNRLTVSCIRRREGE